MFRCRFVSAVRSTAFLFATLVPVSVSVAQSSQTFAVANVPFAFRFGNQLLPAGRYQFRMSSGQIVQLSGASEQSFGMVRVEDGAGFDHKGKLVFRQDDGFELQEISAPAHGLRLFCPRHRAARAAGKAQLSTNASVITLALAEPGR